MAVKAFDKVTLVRVDDGAKGEKGETGIGASAIVEQYYLSTSSAEPSGGAWSEVSPAWS